MDAQRPHRRVPLGAQGTRVGGRSLALRRDSTDITTLQQQYPDNPALHSLSADTRLVVSEPLGDLHGVWREMPESTCVVTRDGVQELLEFRPRH
ncbi:hypothetical protein ACFOWZ_28685 [Lentzea rhizosphaerae]|uniref:Uncharacterized protein n=1 Tax=Lentzea rhizosphaerae TaxID=2041025 RepID=A0ABV8C0G8_9PSEU